MTQAFLTVLDMSLKASYVIATVCLLRCVFQFFGYPRRYCYLLWGIVVLRLLLPVTVTSSLSRLPYEFSQDLTAKWASSYTENTHRFYEYTGLYDTAVAHGNRPETDAFGHQFVTTGEDRVSPPKTVEDTLLPTLSAVWAIGVGAMLLWNGAAMLRLRKRLREAIPLDHQIYISDQIDTAFVLGILRPRIYLPAALTDTEQAHILRHERYHIHRHDHKFKLLSTLLLCVHWFNPLVWAAYVLAVRDMELSCDEAVTAELDEESKSDYAQTLLNLTAGHKRFHAAPVAFGEGDTYQRIKHVFRFRKPPKWVCAVAVCLVLFTAVGMLTDPKADGKQFGASMYGYEKVAYVDYLDSYYYPAPGLFCLTTDNVFWVRNEYQGWDEMGPADLYEVTAEEMNAMMQYRLVSDTPIPITKVTDAKIVRFVHENGRHMFYLLTRHTDGKYYIAFGYSASEFYEPNRMTIHSLYPVTTAVGEMSSNTPFYQRCLVSMLDDAVDVFSTYHARDGWQIVGFRTGIPKTTYGWALFHVQNGAVTFTGQMQRFENAAGHNNGILLSNFPAVCNESGNITDRDSYDVILIANPEVAEMQILSEQNTQVFPALQDPDMVAVSWESMKGKQVYYHFYNEQGGLVSDTEGWDSKLTAMEQFLFNNMKPLTNYAEALLHSSDTTDDSAPEFPLPESVQVTVFGGEHTIVQFNIPMFPGQYGGIYYSPKDVPAPFQNVDIPLTESEDGWAWEDEGDNHGTTKRITKYWFSYEANF